MAAPLRHVRHQGPVIAALGRAVLAGATQRFRTPAPPVLPGPVTQRVLPPRPAELVRDYIRGVGGSPSAWRGVLPPHFFPQWGFPLAMDTLRDIPYPLFRVMNGGARMEVRGPLPADQPLHVTVQLVDIDDNGRRAVLTQRIVTGTAADPELLVAYMYPVVPIPGPPGGKGKRERPRVPDAVREVGFWRLGPKAGLDFAKLTGDFNPIHWVPSYARASGFRNTILHGFATMARAFEGLCQGLFSGATPIRLFDVKFTRPLVLPARVGLYVDGHGGVFVGDAPGGPAYMVGRFEV